jgi:hypothetical protein
MSTWHGELFVSDLYFVLSVLPVAEIAHHPFCIATLQKHFFISMTQLLNNHQHIQMELMFIYL